VKQRVEVDSCPGCGGYWLDHGELEAVRREFATANARKRAAEQFLDDLDDQHVKQPCPEKSARGARAQTLSALLVLVGSRYV
jgi:Zn-finger nucleic acid-binding protein